MWPCVCLEKRLMMVMVPLLGVGSGFLITVVPLKFLLGERFIFRCLECTSGMGVIHSRQNSGFSLRVFHFIQQRCGAIVGHHTCLCHTCMQGDIVDH
nr:hypothetical protein Iba_chr06dCG10940 [Ipomoea batatas]